MSRTTELSFISYLIGVLALCSGAYGGGRQSAIKAVGDRLSQIQNVKAIYEMDVDRTPPSPALRDFLRKTMATFRKKHPGAIVGPPMEGHYEYRCQFSFLNGSARYEQIALSHKAIALGPLKEVQTETPQRVEKFFPPKMGVILVQAGPVATMPISLALGLRPLSHRHWLWVRRRQIDRMAYLQMRGGRFSLTQKTARGFEYCWIFRPKPTLRLVAFKGYYKLPASDIRWQYVRARFSDFHTVASLSLPGRAEVTLFGSPRFPGPLCRYLLKRIAYTVGAHANTPMRYFIVWPRGCTVIDERIDHVFHINRPTILSDKEIFRRLKKLDNTKER
jgi:hypothetical protein